MARIPQSEVERIKADVDLVALIQSKGLELKKHGSKDLAARCPFHEDGTASLIVTPAKNLWHCLGCGKGGSVIDFVMAHEGLSFRHAFEVLAHGATSAVLRASRPVKHSFAPKLASPVAFEADDYTVTRQVLDYYHERLKQTPAALAYLQKRGITAEGMAHFHLGFADRTLGLRLPVAATRAGGDIRERLKKIGLLRAESGHEHFNGCAVFPIFDGADNITEVYGRKINDNLREGTAYHLYLPGPHVGIWNAVALRASREIILCEAVIDALTFWCAGFRNVTTIYGTEGFTDELFQALLAAKTERVYLAYDRDTAGDRAAARDAARFLAKGVECLRIKFPGGMDANEYARKVTPAAQSLRLLIQSAEWLGKGAAPEPSKIQASEPEVSFAEAPRASSSLAAELAAEPMPAPEPAAKKEREMLPVERHGADITITLGERSYRIRGLEKNPSFEVLRVNLRLMCNGLYHVNVIDLYQARQRQAFIEEAARETLLDAELIKRDLGRLLLKLEELQEERLRESQAPAISAVTMEDTERAAALELLRDPRLLERLLEDFAVCGIVGERTNKLTGYLAAVSRLLDKPLGVIIQSTSAAGKSSLMEAVLAFVPEEEKIKYSAMTGQSLYYLGERDLKNKILAIVEEEGAEKASYALKLLQSEGELTIASTSKDEHGRLKTEEYHVEGPVMIFLTTTAVDVDEELLNRCLVLTVDESRAQTEAIHRLQREAETLDGLQRKLERERVLVLHRNAQRLLRPLAVVNPFALRLTFLSDRTRTRRDHVKYLTLIRTVTLLHQYQREVRKLPDGTPYIEVTLEDIAAANRLAHEVLGRSLDELPPQTRKLLALIQAKVRELCAQRQITPDLCLFSRREVRGWTGWSQTQLKVHLDRLADLEYLLPHRGARGQSFVYELLFDGDVTSGGPQLVGLIEAERLSAYDENLSGVNGHLSWVKTENTTSNRGQNGAVSGSNRDEPSPGKPHKIKHYSLRPSKPLENAQPGGHVNGAS
jgi:DNA primase catalytic core